MDLLDFRCKKTRGIDKAVRGGGEIKGARKKFKGGNCIIIGVKSL